MTSDSIPYVVYGNDYSPYSTKVLAYCRYKGLPHEWRTNLRDEEYRRAAVLPLVPLVVWPDGEAVQDSTPIIERLEREHPDPSICHPDPVADFLSRLLEEFGDEWGNKWMFHYRWNSPDDRRYAALRAAGGDESRAGRVADRMGSRLGVVGSNPATAPLIEVSFSNTLRLLERHLEGRAYLLGDRPSLADFGLGHQLYQASIDLTAGGVMEARAPRVRAWSRRMTTPDGLGDFEPLSSLLPTLGPLIREEVGGNFLPWSRGNALALADGSDGLSVELREGTWTQQPMKYHAKSLEALRRLWADAGCRGELDPLLARLGCLEVLRGD